VQNPGRAVGKDELLSAVWGGRIIEESNLGQAIYLLRRALGRGEGGDGYIVTAPGRGYRFSADVHEVHGILPHSGSRSTATAPAIDASVEGFAASQADAHPSAAYCRPGNRWLSPRDRAAAHQARLRRSKILKSFFHCVRGRAE